MAKHKGNSRGVATTLVLTRVLTLLHQKNMKFREILYALKPSFFYQVKDALNWLTNHNLVERVSEGNGVYIYQISSHKNILRETNEIKRIN